MDCEGLPEVRVPEDALGPTKKHRHQGLYVCCQGRVHELGWVLFGKDGSLYFHPKGTEPIVEMGTAVRKGTTLVDCDAIDVSLLPLDDRRGLHLSLHPSGQIHVKSTNSNRLRAGDIGSWLPVTQHFIFAHIFTQPIGKLPEATPTEKMKEFPDPSKSLRLDLWVCPLNKRQGIARVPLYESTMFVGFSTRYSVLVNAVQVSPCEPRIYFPTWPENILNSHPI